MTLVLHFVTLIAFVLVILLISAPGQHDQLGYFMKTDSKLNPCLLVVPRMNPNGQLTGQRGQDYL